MTFNEYQVEAAKTCLPKAFSGGYLISGLASEVGEVAALYKRFLRDDVLVDRDKLTLELGDVLWYVAMLAEFHGIDLDSVAAENRTKLQNRKAAGTINGSGDNR